MAGKSRQLIGCSQPKSQPAIGRKASTAIGQFRSVFDAKLSSFGVSMQTDTDTDTLLVLVLVDDGP